MQGRGQAAVEAQYVATGRLSTLRATISKLFKFFMSVMSRSAEGKEREKDPYSKASNRSITGDALEKCQLSNPPSSGFDWGKLSGHGMSIQGLHFIMQLEGGVGASGGGEEGMKDLFTRYGLPLMKSLLPSGPRSAVKSRTNTVDLSPAGVDGDSECEGVEDSAAYLCKESGTFSEMEESDYLLLSCLVSSPWGLPLLSPKTLHSLLGTVLSSTREALSLSVPAAQEAMLIKYGDLLMSVLIPLCYMFYPATPQQAQCYPRRLFDSAVSLTRLLEYRESFSANAKDCGPSSESIQALIDTNRSETENSVYWPGCIADWSAGGADSEYRSCGRESILLSSAVVSEHLRDIVACFVVSPVWLRSTAMQVGSNLS